MYKQLITVSALTLVLSSCAATLSPKLAANGCLADRPDKLLIIERMIAERPIDRHMMNLDEEGIGASVNRSDGVTRLIGFVPDGPSARSTLREMDVLVCLAPDANGPFYDVPGLSLVDVVNLIRGKAGTELTLRVLRDGGTVDITLVRQRVKPLPSGS